MSTVNTQISTLPNSASSTQSTTSPDAALMDAQAQQQAASSASTSSPTASAAAVYPTATMPPMRDPSKGDALMKFATQAETDEQQGTSAGQQAATDELNEQQQVLTAFQTALGVWANAAI